jgi:hypothetical protein
VKLAEVPAYVIPLSLTHGMCVDTQFQFPHLTAALEALVEPKRGSNIQPLNTSEVA